MSSEAPPQSPPSQSPVPSTAVTRRPEPNRSGTVLVHLLWGLTGIVIGVVLGAAGVGDLMLGSRNAVNGQHALEVAEISGRLDEFRRDLTAREQELSTERESRKEAVAGLKRSLEAAEWNALAASLKSELLTRFLANARAGSAATGVQLADTVCGLSSQSQAARMTIVIGPLQISDDELRGGLRPEVEQFILQNGVAPELLERARRPLARNALPSVTPYNVAEVERAAQRQRMAMRDRAEAVAALRRQVQNIKVARAVRFVDGIEHPIPREVALIMQARKDCKAG